VKKFFKIVIATVIFFAIAYNLTLFYVDANIKERIPKNVYNNCRKIWSARGIYSKRSEQNTIKSLQKAADAGYIGFEIDFYYDKHLNTFIISHDKPKKGKDGKLHYTLKNDKLLTLQEVFEKVGKNHYFWLDYKNLDRLSKEDSLKAVKRLQEISKIYDIKDRIYLEGCTPWHLKYYENAGFKTLLSFHPLPKSHPFHSLSSNFFKMVYFFSSSTALAMQYGKKENPKYTRTTAKNLKDIPQFIFHVPVDENLAKELMKNKDVRVLLMGRDKSVNFGYLNACKENK
jgi:glycerophosphoryl diester phosphodiesterase